MTDSSEEDRRSLSERRRRAERRSGAERRLEGEQAGTPPTGDRRGRAERRRAERRTGDERRLALPLAGQLRTVIELLFHVRPDRLTDEDRRRFDAAILRLRYALESIEDEPPGR